MVVAAADTLKVEVVVVTVALEAIMAAAAITVHSNRYVFPPFFHQHSFCLHTEIISGCYVPIQDAAFPIR